MNGPALRQAYEFLSRYVEQQKKSRVHAYLPAIASLAAACGVSSVTMWKAAHAFAESGAIRIVHGQGIRIAGTENDSEEIFEGSRIPLWEQLRQKILDDVRDGTYPAGSLLPPNKLLQQKYDVSYQMLKKSLSVLVKQRVLKQQRRQYSVPLLTAPKAHSCIVLIAWIYREGRFVLETPNEQICLRTLEVICSQSGIKLEKVGYAFANNQVAYYHPEKGMSSDIFAFDATLGYVFWPVGPLSEDGTPASETVLHRLSRQLLPVAVFDEMGERIFTDTARNNRRVRIFPVAIGSNAAREVGQYAIDSGHRSIAFFSPFHGTPWSLRRADSFRRVVAGAECGAKFRIPDPRRSGVLKLCEFTIDDMQFPYDYLIDYLPLCDQTHKIISRHLNQSLPSSFSATRMLPGISHDIYKAYRTEAIAVRLEPLFRHALENSDITAWVAVNDITAVLAHEFLTANGISMPDRVSLFSFDDTIEAVTREITSYNFNVESIAVAMASYLTNRRAFNQNADETTIDISGFIVKRKSTL